MLAELWMALLPIVGVMFISPARTLAVILLLHTPKKGVTAIAYVVGMIAAMMVLVFLIFLRMTCFNLK